MKVMKFGGTSLANWQRFSMSADIIAQSSQLESVATVLSAPATVTNALLEMVDVAVKGENYAPVLQHVERVFTTLYQDAVNSVLSSEQSELLSQGSMPN